GVAVAAFDMDALDIAQVDSGHRAIAFVVNPLVTIAVGVVVEMGGLAGSADLYCLIGAVVGERAAVTADHIAVVVVGVGCATGFGYRMGACGLTVGVFADAGLAGDVAQPVVGDI